MPQTSAHVFMFADCKVEYYDARSYEPNSVVGLQFNPTRKYIMRMHFILDLLQKLGKVLKAI
jgi:hypothetical protein